MLRYDLRDGFVNDSNNLPETVEEARQVVCNEIDTYAAILRAKIVGNVSPYEAASWSIKLSEAKEKGGPVLALEARQRGVSIDDLAAKVMEKYNAWHVAEAVIAGVSGKHRDKVKQMIKLDEILNYDWREGWEF